MCCLCCGVRWAKTFYNFILIISIFANGAFAFAMIYVSNQAPGPIIVQHLFKILVYTIVVSTALTGSRQTRVASHLQPAESVEALPQTVLSKKYWFYAKLISFFQATIQATFHVDYSYLVGSDINVVQVSLIVWLVLFVVNFCLFHFLVKAVGDVLLGLTVWWTRFPIGKNALNVCMDKLDKKPLGSRAVSMLTRGICWRFLTLWLLLIATYLTSQLMPDPDLYAAFSLAVSRGSGFTGLYKKKDKAAFQQFLENSWMSDASRDAVIPKSEGIQVRGVLKLDKANSRGLQQYQATKHSMQEAVPIHSRWNPSNPTEWSKKSKMSPGVRTTELLKPLPRILGGLADRGEDKLNASINEVMLFHGTPSIQAVQGIMQDGFRIDLAGSNRGTLYGNGAYFADMASKSDDYAVPLLGNSFFQKNTKFLILCKVALGNANSVTPGDQSRVSLHSEYQSKYGGQHLYNEYVVMDAGQAYCPYTVLYRPAIDLKQVSSVAADTFTIAWIIVLALISRVNRVYPG
jgi:hypothetical protein